jgi:hypothetical protein
MTRQRFIGTASRRARRHVSIEGADTALRQVKLRFLAARHFAAIPLAGTGETATCSGPQSKTVRTAISAILGPHYLQP